MSVRGPTGVYWGELVGGVDGFTLTRPRGWDPAVATIQVTRDHVTDWLVKHDPKRFDGLDERGLGATPAVAAALAETIPRRLVALPKVPYVADLSVVEVVGGANVERNLRDMFLVEARVADARLKPDMIELTLADVRRWWVDYGALDLEVNLPLFSGSFYVVRSLRPGGVPWKLREVLQVCLAQLPGRPVITEFPGYLDKPCQPLRAFGASPLEVARQLAANAGLVFELSFDGTAAFWPLGVGLIGECDGHVARNTDEHNPETGAGCWVDLVPQETNLFSRRVSIDAPDEVLVELPPPVWTVQVDYLDPVLPVEVPDGAGGAPTIKLWPVTGELLDGLGLDLDTDTRAALLLRTPLLREAWPVSLPDVPDATRDMFRERLWCWWLLPYRMEERLAPLLPRAEVDGSGARLPVLVEAFGWQSLKAIVEEEIPGLTADVRDVIEKRYAVIDGELARVRQEIKALDQIKAADVVGAWAEIQAVFGNDSTRTPPAGWTQEQKAAASAAQAGTLGEVLDKLGRQAPKALADILQIPNADLLDPALKKLAALKSDETSLKAQRASLLTQLDPTKALQEQLATLATQYAVAIQSSGGVGPTALVAQIDLLKTQIAVLQAQGNRRAKRPVEITTHQNLPRRPVEATWHPGRLLELSEPSGWLVNPKVADPSETLILPLPPRVTFGSYNLASPPPVPFPGGGVSENDFVQAGVDVLAKEPELQAFARDMGHVLPVVPSPGPLRLTFTRNDMATGAAKVGPHPLRITRDGPEWTALYPLEVVDTVPTTQPEVPAAILAGAKALAEAAMREQVLASGSFGVLGARYVLCNGQITAVRWVGRDGNVDTSIHFDGSAEPVPGLELAQTGASPEPLLFGFALEPGEGA